MRHISSVKQSVMKCTVRLTRDVLIRRPKLKRRFFKTKRHENNAKKMLEKPIFTIFYNRDEIGKDFNKDFYETPLNYTTNYFGFCDDNEIENNREATKPYRKKSLAEIRSGLKRYLGKRIYKTFFNIF